MSAAAMRKYPPAHEVDFLPPGSVPDPWITCDRPGCCGPVGGNGPIGWELYVRSGVSIPTGSGILQDTLDAGWMTTIGARTLFFNPATTAAWTWDVGLGYTYNDAGRPNRTFSVLFPFTAVVAYTASKDQRELFEAFVEANLHLPRDEQVECLLALGEFLARGESPPWEYASELLADGLIDVHFALTPRGHRALARA